MLIVSIIMCVGICEVQGGEDGGGYGGVGGCDLQTSTNA